MSHPDLLLMFLCLSTHLSYSAQVRASHCLIHPSSFLISTQPYTHVNKLPLARIIPPPALTGHITSSFYLNCYTTSLWRQPTKPWPPLSLLNFSLFIRYLLASIKWPYHCSARPYWHSPSKSNRTHRHLGKLLICTYWTCKCYITRLHPP